MNQKRTFLLHTKQSSELHVRCQITIRSYTTAIPTNPILQILSCSLDLFVFTALITDRAGCLAGALAGSLALAAPALFQRILQFSGRKSFDMLHGLNLLRLFYIDPGSLRRTQILDIETIIAYMLRKAKGVFSG